MSSVEEQLHLKVVEEGGREGMNLVDILRKFVEHHVIQTEVHDGVIHEGIFHETGDIGEEDSHGHIRETDSDNLVSMRSTLEFLKEFKSQMMTKQ